ncbi:uncharacterized protein LOC119725401 [Patiria miniata]|uniref:C2H2-type domain-containing protein n=1 Tax=Patiria miniata TaxID=46514 RepID=A0A913ZLQ6_PATMI|nr:uncharacterized protein LOC119725401 [Patiria miniata]
MAEDKAQRPETRIRDASPSGVDSDRPEIEQDEQDAPSKQHHETQGSGGEDVDGGNMSRNEDTMLREITTRSQRDWERYLVAKAIPEFQNPEDIFDSPEEEEEEEEGTCYHSNSGPKSGPDNARSDEPDYKATASEKPRVEPGDMKLRKIVNQVVKYTDTVCDRMKLYGDRYECPFLLDVTILKYIVSGQPDETQLLRDLTDYSNLVVNLQNITATMENTFCRTCEVSFTSESHAVSHYAGKKHKKRVDYSRPRPAGARRNRSSSPSTSEEAATDEAPPLNPGASHSGASSPSSTGPQDYDSPGRANESGHYYYCKVCSKNFSGPAPMKQHMEGSAHEKQLRKVRKVASLSKFQDEDPSPQLQQHSTSSKFTRREFSPSRDATTTSDSKPELHLNTPTFSHFAKKPILTPKPRRHEVRSGNFSSGEMGTIRSDLIHMCMEKMKVEIFRVIPIIAASVVDAVLGIYPNGKMEQEETRQDEDGRRDESQDKEDAVSQHPKTETKEDFCPGDDAGGNCSHSSSDDEGLFNHAKASSPGPNQVADGAGEESLGHHGEVEVLQVENDLDGTRFPQNLEPDHNLNFSNIGSGGTGRASGSYYPEQVESHYNNEKQLGGHSGQSSYGLQGALHGDQENMATQFGFSVQEMEENFSSVTSQDLIQLVEPRSVEDEQYHSAFSMATQADNQDGEVYHSASPQAYGKRSISCDERNMSPQLKLGSGPPGLQQHETCFAADASQCELYPGVPPLDGETSDVSDLMNVVTEIIQALDIQVGDGNTRNLVHAPPTEGAMYTLQAEP